MNKHYICFSLLLVCIITVGWHSGLAQIPNASFERWSSGEPDNWQTNNVQPSAINVTQSSDAHAGGSAVAGSVVNLSGFPYAPTLISGTDGQGFPVNSQPPALHGWYKFTPVSGDLIYIAILLSSGDSGVGASVFLSSDTQSVYREFAANIIYGTSTTPDTGDITATIIGIAGFPHIGSGYIIDDLSFGPLAAVDERGNVIPEEFSLLQNYPNPFNPSTIIQYAIPHAGNVHLGVYDLMGREVVTLVDGQQGPGSYRAELDASHLSNGVYFYRLQTGGYSQTRKLMLVK
jgi:hypothetical protein